MWPFFHGLKAVLRFHDYGPQPVTLSGAIRWMRQFQQQDRRLAGRLLDKVIYLSEKDTRAILLHQNRVLMENLAKVGLPAKKLIYLQTDEAGSSSPVMLSMIRNEAGLQQRGCKLLDSRDALGINKTTNKLEEGALIYIDDFVGSGDQFCKARAAVQQSVVGTFSEFLLVPSICEEGYQRLIDLGIAVYTGRIHARAERPLHANSHILNAADRCHLVEMCKKIRPNTSLGYNDLATMVVLYRNAPNSIPAVLRGSDKQTPFYGMFPRYKDLPVDRVG
jgi:hypothetical protein